MLTAIRYFDLIIFLAIPYSVFYHKHLINEYGSVVVLFTRGMMCWIFKIALPSCIDISLSPLHKANIRIYLTDKSVEDNTNERSCMYSDYWNPLTEKNLNRIRVFLKNRIGGTHWWLHYSNFPVRLLKTYQQSRLYMYCFRS